MIKNQLFRCAVLINLKDKTAVPVYFYSGITAVLPLWLFFHFLRQNKINKAFSVLSIKVSAIDTAVAGFTLSNVIIILSSNASFNFCRLFPLYYQCLKIALHAQLSRAWNKTLHLFSRKQMARETINYLKRAVIGQALLKYDTLPQTVPYMR